MTTKQINKEKQQVKIAVVRVRGKINLNEGIKNTFEMLNLHNKNGCVVINNDASYMGMINKVKDYVTWGEITEETYNEMVEKRAELFLDRESDSKSLYKYNRYFIFNKKKYKKFISLMPPVKGYGQNGIKMPFKKGGALGDRKEKINDLIRRMI